MTSPSSIRDTFFEECEDLIEVLFEGLAVMNEGQHDAEVVNAVFRAVHSVKGGAGAFGLETVVGFAHTYETLLDAIRSNEIEVDPELMRVLLRAADQLSDLIEAARDEREPHDAACQAVLAELETYLDAEQEDGGDFDLDLDFDAVALDFDAVEADAVPAFEDYLIRFRPHRALYRNGHEPLLLIRALGDLGEVEVTLDESALPPFDALDAEDAYLAWTIRLSTVDGEGAIHEIFEFVDGLCDLAIERQEPPAALGEPEIEEGPDLPEPADGAEKAAAPDPDPEPSPPPVSEPAKGPRPTLRVDLDRVDRLINTVGELIINQAMLSQRITEMHLPGTRELAKELEDYKALARDIQEGVMAIRAQAVKPLFQRMARIVREGAGATGKEVRLVTVGEDTEVDKTVIERLADPLTHMIRNAIDHGLERPERRRELGKPETGEIRLAAAHRSGSVFIEIADDGAGLNRPRILEKAIERGLISAGSELPDSEIDNLLFMPGFSTASEVSNLSGRGVGMDVVRNAIQALGGRVSIASAPGKGTTFTIVLPLTLAVMDGMTVSIAGQVMVIPLASVLETLRAAEARIHPLGENGRVLSIRDNYVPIIDVAHNLGLTRPGGEAGGEILVLVETEDQGQCALGIDAIHDQRQVVVKSLESNYGSVPGISAATILGDGKIALILDPEGIARLSAPALAGRTMSTDQDTHSTGDGHGRAH